MKIADSSIVMESAHHETSYTYKESVTMRAAASKDLAGAILTLSEEAESKSYVKRMQEYQKKQEEDANAKREEREAKSWNGLAERLHEGNHDPIKIEDTYDMKIKMLRKMLAALRGEKEPVELLRENGSSGQMLDFRSKSLKVEHAMSLQTSASLSVGTSSAGTLWQRVTATSGFTSETESTTFASQGMVTTQDGRSIAFGIEVSMSRAFTSKIDTLEVQDYIMTDPLMINLDTNIGTVSDQKFFFDLNADGKEEEMSFAGKGSGFLALDKNQDGKIGDGSELFGTASGDGFLDLAAYDEDKNGWIDENDSVFGQLKIWTKDEDGNDRLIDLKQADVGAIYLGNADTQFSLKDDANRMNGAIRQTGIYLKESSGQAGTIQHVDLAI